MLNPSYNKAFLSHFSFTFARHKCIKRTLNTRLNTCFVHKKREYERYFLRVSVESKRESYKSASFKVVLYSHISGKISALNRNSS